MDAMSGLVDGFTNLFNGIAKLLQVLELLLTWLIWFVQLPFGLGPLGKFALPFNTFILFLLFAIVGYKTKFSISEINDILNSFDRYADQSITKAERFVAKRRRKRR